MCSDLCSDEWKKIHWKIEMVQQYKNDENRILIIVNYYIMYYKLYLSSSTIWNETVIQRDCFRNIIPFINERYLNRTWNHKNCLNSKSFPSSQLEWKRLIFYDLVFDITMFRYSKIFILYVSIKNNYNSITSDNNCKLFNIFYKI